MNFLNQTVTIYLYTFLVLAVFILFTVYGIEYYSLPVEQRFFHALHEKLKPSGWIGHGLGIVGSLCMIVGVGSYMARKHIKRLSRIGTMKNWLQFHIFLCSIGPLMVLYHTSFKFGGIVSISFWSMVAVVISGVIGRFIYNQIPRSIQGNEMSLQEVLQLTNNIKLNYTRIARIEAESFFSELDKGDLNTDLLSRNPIAMVWQDYLSEIKNSRQLKIKINSMALEKDEKDQVFQLVRAEVRLKRKIKNLQTVQKVFRLWHVIHLPFALIMLVIMVIHIVITLTFGYRWIF